MLVIVNVSICLYLNQTINVYHFHNLSLNLKVKPFNLSQVYFFQDSYTLSFLITMLCMLIFVWVYTHIFFFWIGCGVGRGKEVGKAEAFQNLRLDLLQSYLFVNFMFIKFLFYLFFIYFDIDLKLYGWDYIFWFCFLLQLFAFFFSKQKRRWICGSVWPIY